MRRSQTFALAAIASVAALALGAAGAAAETVVKKKSVPSTVTAAFVPGPPSGDEYALPSGTFSGKVGSAKNKCVKSRSVAIQRPNGSSLGQASTNSSGDWTIAGTALAPGQYPVTVEKSKIIKEKDKPNGTHVKKKVICEAVTATVAVS